MIFRIDRFFLDEKDLFVFLFGIFLVASYFFKIPVLPFRFESLVVLFVFLIITRSMVSPMRFGAYFLITLLGVIFSLALSPYGLAIYLFIAMIIYLKIGAL